MFLEACSYDSRHSSLKPSQLLPRKPPINKMAEQTTHQTTKPKPGKTGSEKRPDILKEPQNLCLLAEARSDQTGLNDAVQVVEGLLSAMEQVGHWTRCPVNLYDFELRGDAIHGNKCKRDFAGKMPRKAK